MILWKFHFMFISGSTRTCREYNVQEQNRSCHLYNWKIMMLLSIQKVQSPVPKAQLIRHAVSKTVYVSLLLKRHENDTFFAHFLCSCQFLIAFILKWLQKCVISQMAISCCCIVCIPNLPSHLHEALFSSPSSEG